MGGEGDVLVEFSTFEALFFLGGEVIGDVLFLEGVDAKEFFFGYDKFAWNGGVIGKEFLMFVFPELVVLVGEVDGSLWGGEEMGDACSGMGLGVGGLGGEGEEVGSLVGFWVDLVDVVSEGGVAVLGAWVEGVDMVWGLG